MTDLQTKLVTQDILERSGSQPIYLSTIEVVGGETFSSNFFKKILSPLTENSDYTLSQLLQNVDQSYSRLMKTDVFKKVEISLHSDYVKKLPEVTTYNSEPSIPTKVLFDLSSINLNNGDVFLNLNSDDVLNLDLNYLNNNFFENAEIINLHANYNPYKPNQHLFSDGKLAINLPNPLFKLVGHFYNTNSNNQAWQQLLEHTTGIFSGLQYLSECKNLIALVGLGAAKRTLHDISDVALDDLKFFGGDYMKKSIVAGVKFNKFQYLNKITKNFPTDGVSIELDNEISTNEDVLDKQAAANVSPFAKSTLSAKLFKSFCSNSITTQLAFNLGGIFTNASSPVSIHTSDRFYLGVTIHSEASLKTRSMVKAVVAINSTKPAPQFLENYHHLYILQTFQQLTVEV